MRLLIICLRFKQIYQQLKVIITLAINVVYYYEPSVLLTLLAIKVFIKTMHVFGNFTVALEIAWHLFSALFVTSVWLLPIELELPWLSGQGVRHLISSSHFC